MKKNKEVITGSDFKRMLGGAYALFAEEYERIDALNVFPVPDGDTGTNMLRTLGAAEQAIRKMKESGIGALAKRAADSAILGARGNSGVLLSQIFRGLGRGLAGKWEATSGELGKAFQYGVLYAYRSVAKPVEGTILTVAKQIAKGAYHAVRADLSISEILEAAIAAGEKELQRTPELLPALKEAGVVDAGGTGLLVFLKGCLQGLSGEFAAPNVDFEMAYKAEKLLPEAAHFDTAHPYCTEFLVGRTKVSVEQARRVLANLGDSLLTVKNEDVLKVHIHTARPGLVLEQAVGWGLLHDIKIDNMADQHKNALFAHPPANALPSKKTAIIAVAAGDGFADILRQMGADHIVAGGQSMNPSVEDFIEAVHIGRAERYVFLPNNKNILLAAMQAKKLLGERAEVVATANLPQGIAALLNYEAKRPLEENLAAMRRAAQQTKAAAVTIAVRDSKIGGRSVSAGDYIAAIDGKVPAVGRNLTKILLAAVENLLDDESEIVSLYYGAEIEKSTAELLARTVQQKWPKLSVELYRGGQPVYALILSVE